MALRRVPVDLFPDTSGKVWWEPSAVGFELNDRYPGGVYVFEDTPTRDTLGFEVKVPKNYVGSPALIITYGVTVNIGDVRLEADYTSIAPGESLDPSADQGNVGVTDTVPGTPRLMKEVSLALTAAHLAADDLLRGLIALDGADAATTLVGRLYVKTVELEYSDA